MVKYFKKVFFEKRWAFLMKTRYKSELLSEIKARVKNGELIVYPTDTVYGLGVSIHDVDAIKRVYEVKSRAFRNNFV